jgi:hypothetical protein
MALQQHHPPTEYWHGPSCPTLRVLLWGIAGHPCFDPRYCIPWQHGNLELPLTGVRDRWVVSREFYDETEFQLPRRKYAEGVVQGRNLAFCELERPQD